MNGLKRIGKFTLPRVECANLCATFVFVATKVKTYAIWKREDSEYIGRKKEINCSFAAIINQNCGIKFVYMGFAFSKTAFNFIGIYFPNFRVKWKIERFMIIPWFVSIRLDSVRSSYFRHFRLYSNVTSWGKKWLISKVLLDDISVAEIGIFATLVVTGAIIYHSGWLFPNFTRTSRGPNFPGFDLQNHL